jgi:hypothetical protein
MSKRNKVYLISDTGAAMTNHGNVAAIMAMELAGYRRCTREEYHQQIRRIRAEENRQYRAEQALDRQR